MEPGQSDTTNAAAFEADVTRHLRDHLECARKLASIQNVPVVVHLVQMAILALSDVSRPGDANPV